MTGRPRLRRQAARHAETLTAAPCLRSRSEDSHNVRAGPGRAGPGLRRWFTCWRGCGYLGYLLAIPAGDTCWRYLLAIPAGDTCWRGCGYLGAARLTRPVVYLLARLRLSGIPAGEDAAADDGDAGADGVAERAADGDPQRVLLRRLPRRRGPFCAARGAARRGGSGRTAGSGVLMRRRPAANKVD